MSEDKTFLYYYKFLIHSKRKEPWLDCNPRGGVRQTRGRRMVGVGGQRKWFTATAAV